MSHGRCSLSCLLAALAVIACEPGGPATGGAVGGGAGDEAGDRRRVEEVMRIGTVSGDPSTVFGRIGAIGVDPDGNVLVFDALAQELRVFTPDGLPRMTFGRAGSGPGEFGNVLGFAVAPNRSIWVVDARNARYTVITEDGSHRSFPRTSRIARQPWVGGFGADGSFYEYATDAAAGRQLMLQVDGTGETTGEHVIPTLAAPRPDFGGGGITMELPFGTTVLRAWDRRGRVWQALSSEYRIANVTLGGDTAVVVSRTHRPAPLTPAQKDSLDSAVQRIQRVLLGQTVDPSLLPTTVPPLRWFTMDDEDRLWVCATGGEPCTELDVFGADGSYLGTVPLSVPVLDVPTPQVWAGRLYAAVEGELGVPQLFVGRVVAPGG